MKTLGIGSVPHQNTQEALEQTFKLAIPYLPRLTQFEREEMLIPNAFNTIEGNYDLATMNLVLSTIKFLDINDDKIGLCFKDFYTRTNDGFKRKKIKKVKIQFCGPVTAACFFKINDEEKLELFDLMLEQIEKKIKYAIQKIDSKVIIFLDEPSIMFVRKSMLDVMIPKLNILIKKYEQVAEFGMHCCSKVFLDKLELVKGLTFFSFDYWQLSAKEIRNLIDLSKQEEKRFKLVYGVYNDSNYEDNEVAELLRDKKLNKYYYLSSVCGMHNYTIEKANSIHDALKA
ncbi:MAG: hypothetical protein ACI9QD_000421 [Thermoproteota archaeon]|jgi:hypothetical protein